MKDFRFCEECGTANGPDFKYCKNCGARLSDSQEGEAPVADEAVFWQDSDEISIEELSVFAGKNGNKIAQKISAMRFFGRKISWCWPVFLFTWFFGIAGAGIWFLYRRMYRLGAALLAVSLLFSTIGLIANSGNIKGIVMDVSDCFGQNTDPETGNINEVSLIEGLEEIEKSENVRRLNIYSNFSNLINAVISIVFGLYAIYLYERFAIQKIKGYNRKLTPIELSLAGGTAGGGVALGIISYIIAEMAAMILILTGIFI
ncbi:MAG: zinc ribbon domain-containing protein [Clostridia bacterium]|nr:zinc ribbon domain-containing protein [Clostridia bacterium]